MDPQKDISRNNPTTSRVRLDRLAKSLGELVGRYLAERHSARCSTDDKIESKGEKSQPDNRGSSD